MRLRAIRCALYFGLVPWRRYEDECHYEGMSYRAHARLNLGLALRWATLRETEEDIEFELCTNSRHLNRSLNSRLAGRPAMQRIEAKRELRELDKPCEVCGAPTGQRCADLDRATWWHPGAPKRLFTHPERIASSPLYGHRRGEQ